MLSNMTDLLLPVLREASRAILDIYADESRFHTEIKADDSPLTEADKRSNRIICAALADLFPGVPVISEELRQAPYELRKDYDEYFLVDPLDGTKEFIKRNGEFTINIAFLQGHRPVGGYVYVPCTDLAYTAEYGQGAYRMNLSGEKSLLRSRAFRLTDEGLHVVASRSHRDPLTEKMIGSLQKPQLVSTGSSLKFLLLAEGTADFYPRFAPTMEWDTAAAQCVLEEAGGQVIGKETLEPLVYNKLDLVNPYFIATGALLDPESLGSLPGIGLNSY